MIFSDLQSLSSILQASPQPTGHITHALVGLKIATQISSLMPTKPIEQLPLTDFSPTIATGKYQRSLGEVCPVLMILSQETIFIRPARSTLDERVHATKKLNQTNE
jgi:hypothetical protein